MTQTFLNGGVDGTVGQSVTPPGWVDVPFTDPASQALAAIQATADVCDAGGPNAPGGINGNPFGGATMVSGLHASDGGTSFWHEGIMQNVSGFTAGNNYSICFYQAVVKQMNCLDESGSWRVYVDNTLVATTAPSNSSLVFNSTSIAWDVRTVTFTATATSHDIKFLPWDDDTNQLTSTTDITGALRMGIDEISFSIVPGDPTITPAGPFCTSNPTVILMAADGGGTWAGTGIVNTATGAFDPSTAGIGTHTVTYELPSGCGGVVTDSIDIVVSDNPNASWTTPGTICEADGAIDLSTLITGDPGGTWSGTGVNGSNFNPAGLSGPVSITYSVGTPPCNASSQQDITVVTNPDPSWAAPTTLCSTSPLFDLNTTVTGTTGGNWSGIGVSGTLFDPSAGTQSVTYTVGSGSCLQMLTLTIPVGTTADPSWAPFTLCSTDPPFDLNSAITGDPGGTWSGTGVTGNIFNPSAGTQDITYTVGSSGCEASSTQAITVVNLQLTASVTAISCFGAADGSATVNVSGASGGQTYSWNTSPVQTTASISNLGDGTYTVTVTDGSCTASDDVIVTEPQLLTGTISVVNGCLPSLGSASITVNGGTGSYSYSWNHSASTTNTATGLDSNMHVVTVTDANGCSYTDSAMVQVFDVPIVNTNMDTTLIYGDCITLSANGASSYLWTPDTYLDCPNCDSTEVCPAEQTFYCVEGTDTNGCKASDCVTIDVEIICGDVFVPSAFSPNGDGENDLECVYSDCMQSMTFTVYNRWGQKVFETNSTTICWDGTWKGKKLNSAVFVYILEGFLINGQHVFQKGNISLIR